MRNEFEPAIPAWFRRSIESFAASLSSPSGVDLIEWRAFDLQRLPRNGGMRLQVVALVDGDERVVVLEDKEIADPRYQADDWARRSREMARRSFLELLTLESPWGVLTGVRPGKLYRMLRRKGFSPREAEKTLRQVHGLAPAKIRLLREVYEVQDRFLTFDPHKIGVYVGIPFCPTRCRYCSFASYPLASHGHLVSGFLKALTEEIRFYADFCRETGWKVAALYIGGGTPTVLSAGALDEVIGELSKLPVETGAEFTVEAGRPETITREHLEVCRRWGVNRISVNPQTMNEKTLRLIGRNHAVRDVWTAVDLVRQAGIPVLNMDLIAGLPGENFSDLEHTLDEVLQMAPENITVHTLAPKRAAEWKRERWTDLMPENSLADWLDSAGKRLRDKGWRPYYLYRQRRIMADQENIGYALPLRESAYNIWMMEECRTVLGLGGGAVTKWVDSVTGHVERRSNPKCPATFARRLPDEMVEKAGWLKGHLN